MESEDRALARRIADGDPAALAEWQAAHHAPIYRFLRHLTGHRETAEDLAQATFLRARAAAGRFDGRAPMRAWVLRIAYREFLRWRRLRPWLRLDEFRPDPADAYARVDEAQRLAAALARLTPELRAPVLLHYLDERPVVEVALALDLPEGTVKRRLFDARARLRCLLETP
jgi:RNA polymerase sigma-70 factor, ECF subfamily